MEAYQDTPTHSGSKRVVAVIPVHNRRDTTLQCLRSLSRLRCDGFRLSVVVVDDGSSDGTGESIRTQYPDVDVVSGNGDLWYAEGTNVGIRRALEIGADYVWQMNDDQVFDESAIQSLFETAQSTERSVVGSLLLLWDMPHRVFQVAPKWTVFGGGWRHWRHQTVWTVPTTAFEVDLIVGNSIIVPAKAYAEVGLLDSKRFHLYGDAEFSARLRKAGYKLLVEPRSRVFCEPNTPPPSISAMSWSERASNLFGDGRKRHSLRSRLGTLIATGPNPVVGMAAFFVFLFRAALGRSFEGPWAAEQPEEELRKTVRLRSDT